MFFPKLISPLFESWLLLFNNFGTSTLHQRARDGKDLPQLARLSVMERIARAERMRRAFRALQKRGLPLAVNQVRYSLLDRSIETNGILDTAKELGITIIAYTPLASGVLTGKYHKNPELLQKKSLFWRARLQGSIDKSRKLVMAMDEIGAKYNATPGQVALNWVIHSQSETIVTIPGATKVRQAEESSGAMKFRLSDDEIARLDELSRGFR
jgi:aryl-alcohol dehydrogenase-like predicted oxidoreductase